MLCFDFLFLFLYTITWPLSRECWRQFPFNYALMRGCLLLFLAYALCIYPKRVRTSQRVISPFCRCDLSLFRSRAPRTRNVQQREREPLVTPFKITFPSLSLEHRERPFFNRLNTFLLALAPTTISGSINARSFAPISIPERVCVRREPYQGAHLRQTPPAKSTLYS